MADWKDTAGPGSFRGVPFYTDRGEQGGGRQAVVHKYPFSEKPPFTEDLGADGRTFQVELYVLGADYLSKKEALINALEKPGPGPLVHPWFGTRNVVALSFRVREERDRGGGAWFTVEFQETSTALEPSITIDPAEQLADTAAVAEQSISDEFLAAYDAVTSLRDSVAGALRSASLAVTKATTRVQMEIQANASLRKRLDDLTDSAVSLVNAPESILASTIAIVDALVDAVLADTSHPDPSSAILQLYDFDPGTRPTAATATRAVEQVNFDATQRLWQRLALVKAAVVASQQTFVSYEDAVRVRLAITDLVDTHVESATDDTAPSLTQLRADLVEAVPGAQGDLPTLQQYTPPGISVPSLVLAHRLYGNVALEGDLLARNKIVNPCFVPGGRALEVLSRG